jgi:hypothetical protein
MLNKNWGFGVTVIFVLILISCNQQTEKKVVSNYKPDSKALYDSIVHMDSVLFGAYNVCDLSAMADCFSEDIEFYHDKGGLMNNKDSIMAATKKNICGKVKRVLIEGSIEVYAIKDYGAIEIGQHFFINNKEPKNDNPSIGKFVHTWKNENGKWRLTRVISLH